MLYSKPFPEIISVFLEKGCKKACQTDKNVLYCNAFGCEVFSIFGGIAQLVRALASHARGRRFESYCLYQKTVCGIFPQTVFLCDSRAARQAVSPTPSEIKFILRQHDLLFIQIAEHAVFRKMQDQAISRKPLRFRAELSVYALLPVFPVSEDKMSDIGKVCADLMGTPRDKLHLE